MTGTPSPLPAGPPLRWLDAVASTQDVLVAAAREGQAAQAVATTSQQAGRGRRGRQWSCPAGDGLAVSVLLRPTRADGWTWLPLLTGVAVHRALDRLGARDCVLKWPNDVLARGGKLAGLLADRVEGDAGALAGTAGGAAVVLGIGVNLRSGALPVGGVGLDAVVPGRAPGAVEVASSVLLALATAVQRWEQGDDHALREAYRRRCATLGRAVSVTLPGGAVVGGRAVDVDADGRLVVAASGGALVPLSAGDVVHVRAPLCGEA